MLTHTYLAQDGYYSLSVIGMITETNNVLKSPRFLRNQKQIKWKSFHPNFHYT